MELSEKAVKMLKAGKVYERSKGRNEVIAELMKYGVLVYDKVVDFEVEYGGINFGGNDERGMTLGLTNFEDVYEIDGNYYFECAYYNCSNPVNILMNKDGVIYEYHHNNDGKNVLYKISDCIEELIEEYAKKFPEIESDIWVEVASSPSREEAEEFFKKWAEKNHTWFEKISLENDVRIDTILTSNKKCLVRYMVKKKVF